MSKSVLDQTTLDSRTAALSTVGGGGKTEEFSHADIVEDSSSSVLCVALRHTRRFARAGWRRCFDYRGTAGAAGV